MKEIILNIIKSILMFCFLAVIAVVILVISCALMMIVTGSTIDDMMKIILNL